MNKKITLILAGIIFSLFNFTNISAAQNVADIKQGMTVQKVTFQNNEITVVGNLYTPANFDKSKKYPAIIVVHPFGGVKEQTSGHYAEKLAEQGFITLAYDASYQGESGGTPRLMEIPDMRIEDVSSAVDYLTTLSKVDENRIGALGICTGGVYAIKAAQRDYRIKSVAGVSTFDLGRARREGLNNSMSYEERAKKLEEVGKQRTRQARGEKVLLAAAIPDSPAQFTDKTPVLYKEGYEYYRTPRGQHPNAPARYAFISLARQMDFFPFDQIDTISPRPVLFVAGSEADTLYYSEDGYNRAKEPRELFLIPGATHMDLYDKPQYVPQVVAKLAEFYGKNL